MELTSNTWIQLVGKIASAFRLTEQEKSGLETNKVAKLIAAIPYNSECENMERTSLTHLSTYMIAKNPACKPDFSHNNIDDVDVLKRIQPLNTFQGGLKEIIKRGINLLALVQLEDHQHDRDLDRKENKYNPILKGIWNYQAQRNQLVAAINGVPCPAMDKVMTIEGVDGFWDAG